jgi:hypothetical protein
MSNMTYNPNVDIPPYHGFDNNDGPRAMDFPSDGNFRSNISYDVRDPHPQPHPQQRYDVQYEPRIDSRGDLRMDSHNDLRNVSRIDSRTEHYDARPRRKLKERMVQNENTNRFNWILLLKKIVIYTILFLVLNHIKTHEIVCGLLPFLGNNELLCMTFKGLLFALIITILLPLVL